MTDTQRLIADLAAIHAFHGGVKPSLLPGRHVPFETMANGRPFEQVIAEEWRAGSLLVVRGESGTGKSSAIEYVLSEHAGEFLPVRLRLGLLSDHRPTTEPVAFARHLFAAVVDLADSVSGAARVELDKAARPETRPGKTGLTVGFNMGLLKLDSAHEVQRIAQARSELSDVDAASTVMGVLADEGHTPVLVLDDLDHWFTAEYHQDAEAYRQQFYQRVLRFVRELDVAVVVAAQPRHTEGPAWERGREFVSRVIEVPGLDQAAAIRSVLERRVAVGLWEAGRDEPTPDQAEALAASMLGEGTLDALLRVHQARGGRLRKTLSVADLALGIAADESADVLRPSHIAAADSSA